MGGLCAEKIPTKRKDDWLDRLVAGESTIAD